MVACRRGRSCKAGADSARGRMRATKSCGAGADFARVRMWNLDRLMVLLMVLWCGSVIALMKDRVEVMRVCFFRRWRWSVASAHV